MLTEFQRDYLSRAVRPMQIVVAALAVGVASFLGITLVLGRRVGGGGQHGNQFLTYIALGFTVVIAIVWGVLPHLIAGKMRQALANGQWRSELAAGSDASELGDVGPLASIYQTRLIIGCALLEGIAFLNLIAYMLEQQPVSLLVAGALLLMLVSQIPSLGRLQIWVEDELALLKQLRAMGSRDRS